METKSNPINENIDSQNDNMNELIEKESKQRFENIWSKLDKGTKLNRICLFVKTEKGNKSLNNNQENQLKMLLINRLDSGNLNKISDIIYCPEKTIIVEIKNLVYNEDTKKYNFSSSIKTKIESKSKSKSKIDRHFNRSKCN